MKKQQNSYILLAGHRKSGTTMFHGLFDGHPDICSYPVDLTILYAYFPEFVRGRHSDGELIERLDRVVYKVLEDRVAGVVGTAVNLSAFRKKLLAGLGTGDLRDMRWIIQIISKIWAEETGQAKRPLFMFKETSSEIYACDLYEWFPNLKIIHLVRDPRDNYAALKAGVSTYYEKLGESEKRTLMSLLFRAKLDMRLATMNQTRYGGHRYLVVRFEDLIAHLKETMEKVSGFLNIPFDECLLSPSLFNREVEGNSFDPTRMVEVNDVNTGRWKKRISCEEAKIIEFEFDGVMQMFGYKPEFSVEERADAYAEFYKWANYEYFYSDPFQ